MGLNMRDAFIDELTILAETQPQIALVVGDLGFNVVERFADRFPERFINAGVAEQNMTGLAAGLASEGYHVFTYSIANFPTFRCAEQIRNDVDHHRLPVTVVAVGGGVAYGALGYSHHAVQDYALMRSMPNMVIAAPGDPQETRASIRWLVANPGPSYLRLGKSGEPQFHDRMPAIAPGSWVRVREGDESSVVLSTGAALGAAVARAGDRAVYSLPLWSMASKLQQPAQLARRRLITTFEDHLADGGFGSWLSESVAGTETAARIVPVALSSSICDEVGSQTMLNRMGGLVV
jgi:transketolase